MSDDLLRYYERELLFIRQLAEEFGRQYPGTANRLLLEPNRSADPHVERLIQSFALLAGRVHHKLDDEFPELTDALLSVLYPHYLAPVPSMAVVEFELDAARTQLPDGFSIPRHSALQTPPIEYQPGKRLACRFRTGYDVTLWPVGVTAARLQPRPFDELGPISAPIGARAALRIELSCQGEVPFKGLSLDKLRFHLNGDGPVIAPLYELIFNHTLAVAFRPLDSSPEGAPATPFTLTPDECLGQVGFGPDEGLLPYPRQSFNGYRLITEFFAFSAKFWFLDLGGWRRARASHFFRRAEVILFLDQSVPDLEQAVDPGTFRLGCAPIVNLFEQQISEPILLNRARYDYPIVPDYAHARGLEVYSVDSVTSDDPSTGLATEYQPFYSFRHGGAPSRSFWYASRRPLVGSDNRATEVYLSFVDLDYDPRLPSEPAILVKTTCLNGDPVLRRLRQSGEGVAFEPQWVAPLSAVRCLRRPTPTLRPPSRRGAFWRLLGHLNLNHLSVAREEVPGESVEQPEGRLALQEILSLYDFSDPAAGEHQSAVTRQLIDGILSVKARRVVGRTGGPTASGFARGVEVTVEFDEQKYVGTGAFLFACVLERFLGLYVSINSFTRMVARTRQREGDVKRWPPRAGEQTLV
jgi:type VI secretion system protein ImpG